MINLIKERLIVFTLFFLACVFFLIAILIWMVVGSILILFGKYTLTYNDFKNHVSLNKPKKFNQFNFSRKFK